MKNFLKILALAAFWLVLGSLSLNAQAQTPTPSSFRPEVKACLATAFGEVRYNLIAQGEAQPTAEEMQKGEACFKLGRQGQPAKPGRAPQPKFSPVVEECLVEVLAIDNLDGLLNGDIVPTREDERAVRDCVAEKFENLRAENERLRAQLEEERQRGNERSQVDRRLDVVRGKRVEGGEQGPARPEKPMMSEELKACLIKAVGQQRFNEVSAGDDPTPEEIKKGEVCFRQHATDEFDDPRRHIPPDKLDCIKETLGEARFKELFDDFGGPPTRQEEKLIGKQCFRPQINISPDKLECIKGVVGEARFKQLFEDFEGPPNSNEQQRIGQTCFRPERDGEIVPPGEGFGRGPGPSEFRPQFPPEKLACLKEVLGEERYLAIFEKFEGPPTFDEERQIGKTCFRPSSEDSGRPEGAEFEGSPAGRRVNFSPEMTVCVKEVLGEERASAIFFENKERPTSEEEMVLREECFNKFKGEARPGSEFESDGRGSSEGRPSAEFNAPTFPDQSSTPRDRVFLPPEVQECLKQEVGEARYLEILNGIQVANDEMARAKDCVEKMPQGPRDSFEGQADFPTNQDSRLPYNGEFKPMPGDELGGVRPDGQLPDLTKTPVDSNQPTDTFYDGVSRIY